MKRNRGVVNEIAQRPATFAAVFVAFFALLFVFLAAMDALPNPIETQNSQQSSNVTAQVGTPENPVRIVATDISLDVAVVNPQSTDVTALDDALTQGAVRYPTSAKLGVDGTVLIFGHSSYLPIVYHQYYKTFDGIQNLKTGQTVSVYSGSTEYRYNVVGVRVANATEDVIDLPQNGKHLTLVTCDSFADKTNRFVVTADFVGAYSLSSQ
jgi:LPXTG-site transpeptidase (sortase) family protein